MEVKWSVNTSGLRHLTQQAGVGVEGKPLELEVNLSALAPLQRKPLQRREIPLHNMTFTSRVYLNRRRKTGDDGYGCIHILKSFFAFSKFYWLLETLCKQSLKAEGKQFSVTSRRDHLVNSNFSYRRGKTYCLYCAY